MPIDENEIRQELGIDEEADVGAAIRNLKARVGELEATLRADPASVDKVEMAALRHELAETQKMILNQEAENSKRIIRLEEERNRERAEHMVEQAISKGRLRPANRELALKVALHSTKDFEELLANLPSIDLTERGVASGHELADLEPTPQEVAISKQMGTWNDADPEKSRLRIMRAKARERGMVLPAEMRE